MSHHTEQTVLFPALVSKPVTVAFDQPDTTSDGGAILLKVVDKKLRLTQALACCIGDARDHDSSPSSTSAQIE